MKKEIPCEKCITFAICKIQFNKWFNTNIVISDRKKCRYAIFRLQYKCSLFNEYIAVSSFLDVYEKVDEKCNRQVLNLFKGDQNEDTM